jgi:GntR family transcriptional regulator
LPSARELAASLGINLHTVLRAYQELRDEGVIELRRGRGAVVRQGADAAAQLTPSVAALVAEARRLGVAAATLTDLVREEYDS